MFCDDRFIGLENKQQQGEAQFRAKCEKEKASAACSSRRSRAGLSCLCTGWRPDEHVSPEAGCKKQKKKREEKKKQGGGERTKKCGRGIYRIVLYLLQVKNVTKTGGCMYLFSESRI